MKSVRALVALFVLAVFLAGTAHANTSSVNPNVPAQNSPLSSSVLRGNFANAQSDLNTIFGILALSSNELLGTVNAGNAGPLNLPTCSTGALSWTPGTGFGCNSLSGLVSPITQNLVFTGQIGINLNATALPTKQVGTILQVANADTIASRVESDAFGASAYFTGIRFDGTNASPTTLQNLDEISGINAWGYNGSSIVGPRASVREFAAQNWTGSAQGTRVDIATTLNNTTTMAPVCGFENDGGVTCPPTVTGGDMGAGRINAAGLYVNGVAVSVGNSAFSSLTAALATNSIENGAFTQTWAWDGVTTQTAMSHTSTTITTGQLANFSIANAASTGYAGYFSNTGTAIAYGVYATEGGAANTGYAGYFNNTATATGYALYANGTTAINGNLTVTGTCTGCGGLSFTNQNTNTGTGSLAANTTGTDNTAFGFNALHVAVTDSGNVAVGSGALSAMAIGNTTTAAGTSANTAVGYAALKALTTAPDNTAVGFAALTAATGGLGQNTALGYGAGKAITTGFYNTLIGYNAGSVLTTGQQNVVVGNAAALDSFQTLNATAVGYSAKAGANDVAVGNNALGGTNQDNAGNTAVGSSAGLQPFGTNSVFFGLAAGGNAQGSNETAIGANTLENGTGAAVLTGSNNTAVGASALVVLAGTTTGNTAIGASALASQTTGVGNTALGFQAGQAGTAITVGSNNTLVGNLAQVNSAAASNRTALGQGAISTADNDVVLGNSSVATIHAEVTTITAISDARDKTGIEPTDLGLDFIMKLSPVIYRLKNSDYVQHYGLIAQQAEEALPTKYQAMVESNDPKNQLALLDIRKDGSGHYEMGYTELIAPMIKAIQELKADNDNLRRELAALKKQK